MLEPVGHVSCERQGPGVSDLPRGVADGLVDGGVALDPVGQVEGGEEERIELVAEKVAVH